MKSANYKTINNLSQEQKNWSELCNNIQSIKSKTMYMQETEEMLWNYIDGLCSSEEKSMIEGLIESNLEWQQKYRELLSLHNLVDSTELESPSMRFTKNVMEEIAKHHVAPAAKNYINKKIIWGIGAFFITMIIGIVIFSFAQLHWTGSSNSSSFIAKYDPGKIEWSKYVNNTEVYVFIMINVILGLVFFDAYLRRKKNLPNHNEA
jgi:hypothetical protein